MSCHAQNNGTQCPQPVIGYNIRGTRVCKERFQPLNCITISIGTYIKTMKWMGPML